MIVARWSRTRGWYDGELRPYGPLSLNPAAVSSPPDNLAPMAGLRILPPWLRIAVMVVVRLVGSAFFIAVVMLVAIALLTHGASR